MLCPQSFFNDHVFNCLYSLCCVPLGTGISEVLSKRGTPAKLREAKVVVLVVRMIGVGFWWEFITVPLELSWQGGKMQTKHFHPDKQSKSFQENKHVQQSAKHYSCVLLTKCGCLAAHHLELRTLSQGFFMVVSDHSSVQWPVSCCCVAHNSSQLFLSSLYNDYKIREFIGNKQLSFASTKGSTETHTACFMCIACSIMSVQNWHLMNPAFLSWNKKGVKKQGNYHKERQGKGIFKMVVGFLPANETNPECARTTNTDLLLNLVAGFFFRSEEWSIEATEPTICTWTSHLTIFSSIPCARTPHMQDPTSTRSLFVTLHMKSLHQTLQSKAHPSGYCGCTEISTEREVPTKINLPPAVWGGFCMDTVPTGLQLQCLSQVPSNCIDGFTINFSGALFSSIFWQIRCDIQ